MANKKVPVKQALKALPKDTRSRIVVSIIALYKKGYSKLEIIAAGFNKNTVYRQTREYDIS